MNPYTKAGIDRFVIDGTPPGDFLWAVLTNNLAESFRRADMDNLANMREIVAYCWNHIPADCWGSPKKVEAWIEMKAKEREQRENNLEDRTKGSS